MRRLWIVALIVALLAAGCASPTATPAPESGATDVPATAVPEAADESAPEAGQISVAGSTTVQPLAQLLGEAFTAQNPDVKIDVQGGGSSVGVKSAGQGAADIGMASREIKDSELEEYADLNIFVIAYDGIAAVVHPDVPVDDLTLEQVRDVFAGKITSWSELGGPDELIVVVAREEGSGTRAAFEELVMGDELIADTALLQSSNGAVRTTVSTTPFSMGFLSFGYLDESVKALSVDGVEPTIPNVKAGSYSVFRPLNMVTIGAPEGVVKAWLDWIQTEAGQAIVADEGYISILGGDEPTTADLSGRISAAGSTTVQPLAQLLGEAFTAQNPDVKIDVQGGGSSVGVKSAGQGAADIGMASREIKDSELEEYADLNIFVIAYDGIAAVVHPDVPVDDLTLEQVRDVFAGKITSWSELGGPDELIVVVAREEGSGTRAAFEELVMGDELIADTALLQSSNGAVRTTVSTTPFSMGFLSFGYLDESVKALSVDGVEPTIPNVKAGSYSVFRPLNMVTIGAPEGVVKAWLDWIQSEAAQEIVVDEGYIAAN